MFDRLASLTPSPGVVPDHLPAGSARPTRGNKPKPVDDVVIKVEKPSERALRSGKRKKEIEDAEGVDDNAEVPANAEDDVGASAVSDSFGLPDPCSDLLHEIRTRALGSSTPHVSSTQTAKRGGRAGGSASGSRATSKAPRERSGASLLRVLIQMLNFMTASVNPGAAGPPSGMYQAMTL